MGIPYSGRSTLVVYILPKDRKRVRFPSPAPKKHRGKTCIQIDRFMLSWIMRGIGQRTFLGLLFGIVTGFFYYACTLLSGPTPLSFVCVLGVITSLPFFSTIDKITNWSSTLQQSFVVTTVTHIILSTLAGFIIGMLLYVLKKYRR